MLRRDVGRDIAMRVSSRAEPARGAVTTTGAPPSAGFAQREIQRDVTEQGSTGLRGELLPTAGAEYRGVGVAFCALGRGHVLDDTRDRGAGLGRHLRHPRRHHPGGGLRGGDRQQHRVRKQLQQ